MCEVPFRTCEEDKAPRPYTHTFSRARSSNAEDEEQREDRKKGQTEGARIYSDNDTGLEATLERLGINPDEYRSLYKSQLASEKRQKAWTPKTQAEAKEKWKELQDSPSHYNLLSMYKKADVQPIKLAKERGITLPGEPAPHPADLQEELDALRDPVNVKAMNLRPLRRTPKYGVPVCDLQLRTYSIRNLLLFADFAVRAAYYMGLCARGPIPLPRITERWTVPRANFVFKKSQENFERITMRRLIQIQDGHPDVVKGWLAFLAKHQYHGVGMKANIWEFESLEAATSVGQEVVDGDYTGRREAPVLEKVGEILRGKGYKEAMAGFQLPEEMSAKLLIKAPITKEKKKPVEKIAA
ncbi:30S ribosomal protein-like protein S10 [Pleomassaria siparia CBS 279.74]|uniref:Small ribosomal subunit protein uS10m n=1 Tax=Pleomassaria siparia CBS 279.74 TaxID=1314801 RepID=A0A6G1KQS4_9PLEO|nr:30S ribosomal protein-like protein S10 [Pleomassaria siparia CBS 279.74]